MHILESMASVSRLKIGKPVISPKYYPVAFEKYITIHSSAKFNSRRYDLWNDVIAFIKPILQTQDIKIVQIGGKDDAPLNGVDANLCGGVSFRQTFFIIQNALLHVGVDSLPIHIASAVGTKIVGLYCNMHASQSAPYWTKEQDCILLESDRNGLKPSYAPEEFPKTINLIKPEIIVKSILKLLNIEHTFNVETIFFGNEYKNTYLEMVPDQVVHPDFNKEATLQIRYDYIKANETSENVIYNQLSVRKAVVVTDKPLNVHILKQLKANLVQIIFLVTEKDYTKFLLEAKRAGIPFVLMSFLSQEEITKVKLLYVELGLISLQQKTTKESLKLQDKVNYTNTKIKTNRFLLSQGKIFCSKAHWMANQAIDNFQNNIFPLTEAIDSPELWEDSATLYVYNE